MESAFIVKRQTKFRGHAQRQNCHLSRNLIVTPPLETIFSPINRTRTWFGSSNLYQKDE